ncbi:MAG TPA: hypothetical protein VEL68_13580 [Thermodesulfobacteriota bacterium]|nr:hypothetical protein [Thermodesulfobacteriota bacterium]
MGGKTYPDVAARLAGFLIEASYQALPPEGAKPDTRRSGGVFF